MLAHTSGVCNWLRDRALDRTAAHAAVALGCALPVLPRGIDAEMRSSGGLQLRMPAPELPMYLSHSMRGEEQVLLLAEVCSVCCRRVLLP